MMLTLTIKKERTGPVLGFHPWVFSQAIEKIPDGMAEGTPVRLVDPTDRYLASGYFNSYSQIAVRIWSHEDREEVDARFFRRRIDRALGLRERHVRPSDTNAYRIVNGESDSLPGLIVDRYDRHLVVQFHTPGIERWREEIVAALVEAISPEGIFERSDSARRVGHGANEGQVGRGGKGVLYGAVPERLSIRENGLVFVVDVAEGQKTGFFLDQRDKRAAVGKYALDAQVLNCHSYSGGFGVYALRGGARRVVCVDSSGPALDLARENVKANGFDPARCEFHEADVRRFLRDASPGEFDLVILDPPAFIKDRKKKAEGIVGYRNLNESALRLMAPGSTLLTCSCSAHLSLEEFRYMLSEAGLRSGRKLTIVESFTHGLDHPRLVSFLEGDYLKCFIIEVSSAREPRGGREDL